MLNCFAITAPGLEPVCAAELATLGVAGTIIDGGVEWTGDVASLYRANLCSRTASRVVVRAGSFRARTFAELERHVARIDWTPFLARGAEVSLRVTSRKSKLYHTGAIAERIARVLTGQLDARVDVAQRDDDADDDVAPPQLLVIRFLRDDCTLSVDASGVLLHRRGYRQAVAKAPLRETIAAAMLLAIDWPPDAPLVDPMCGSGTIPIEAALLARHIPPGLANAAREPRAYAFQNWPAFDERTWSDVVTAARSAIRDHAPAPIIAADRNAGAITAARTNATRAAVDQDITYLHQPLSALPPSPPSPHPQHPHYLLSNPPYGLRVGSAAELRDLYAELGHIARQHLRGWAIGLLSADPALEAVTRLPLREVFATRNGGIAVRLVAARID